MATECSDCPTSDRIVRVNAELQPGCYFQFREKFRCRLARCLAQFFKRTALDLGDDLGNFLHISRFTTFAAIRHGREIRTIGFQHELVQRRGGHGVADVLAVLERDNAGETDERADFQNAAHPVGVFAETMKNAADFSGERFELRQRVVKGIALVDDAVQPGFDGDLDLLLENVRLPLFVTRVVIGAADGAPV